MDLTKALDEMKRVREFLSAVTVSEETMRLVGSLSDEVAALQKKRTDLLSAISTLSADYSKAKALHDAAIGRLTSERTAAQDDLLETKREIATSKKGFAAEAESHAATVLAAKKEHAALLNSMREEIAVEQAKLDKIGEAVKKITGLAG